MVTYGGLDRFDREKGTFTVYQHDPSNPQSLSNNNSWQILDGHGALWVGTWGGGVDRFDPKTRGLHALPARSPEPAKPQQRPGSISL